eukprot:8267400-Karenia_brevis.AAC.1
MRVVRRILDRMRFDSNAGSDRQARIDLQVPSIDCILQQQRLLYLQRLVLHGPQILLAMLAITSESSQVPWTRCIINDLRTLARYANLQHLDDVVESAEGWIAFIRNAGDDWCRVVEQIFYVESILDRE